MSGRWGLQLWIAASFLFAVGGILAGDGLLLGVVLSAPLVLISLMVCDQIDRDGKMSLGNIFALALILRWACAAFVHLIIYKSQPGIFAPDENFYDQASTYFVEYLKGHVSDPYPESRFAGGIIWFLASVYYVFGHVPLATKFINCLLGAWSVVLTALIANRIYGAEVARRAGLINALVPSLVLWASLNSKDNSTLLGAQAAIFGYLQLRDRLRPTDIALMLGGLLLLWANRPYETVFVGLALAGATALGTRRRGIGHNLALVAAMGVTLWVVVGAGGVDFIGSGGTDEGTIDKLNALREGYSLGANSAIDTRFIDTSTPIGLLLSLPVGMTYFYLAPIPFTGTSAISIATTPEMVVWYFFLPSAFRALRHALRTRARDILPILLYMAISTVGFSMVVTNVGTLYRYRAQVFFLPIIFIAAEMVRKKHLKAQRRRAPIVGARPSSLTSIPKQVSVRWPNPSI